MENFKQFMEAKEMVELWKFRDDLAEGELLGKPGTLYIKRDKPKEAKRGLLWHFTPIGYDPETQTLTHLRSVISNWWPEYVVKRMESEMVPVTMHEYP